MLSSCASLLTSWYGLNEEKSWGAPWEDDVAMEEPDRIWVLYGAEDAEDAEDAVESEGEGNWRWLRITHLPSTKTQFNGVLAVSLMEAERDGVVVVVWGAVDGGALTPVPR